MKINIQLYSSKFNEVEAEYFQTKVYEYEWNYPVLPRPGDAFNIHSVHMLMNQDDLPEWFSEWDKLSYIVHYFVWEKTENQILPLMFLKGE